MGAMDMEKYSKTKGFQSMVVSSIFSDSNK